MQDQYINHIMNETGATVLLRGRGSGIIDSLHGEGIPFFMQYDLITSLLILPRVVLFVISRISSILPAEGQLPLHLFLSSNNLKSLDDARLLAEHLLDTISVECGVSR